MANTIDFQTNKVCLRIAYITPSELFGMRSIPGSVSPFGSRNSKGILNCRSEAFNLNITHFQPALSDSVTSLFKSNLINYLLLINKKT